MERELWREARRQINEYENRNAELQLDEQRERNALEALKKELEEIQKDTEIAAKETTECDSKSNATRVKLLRLHKSMASGSGDVRRLNEQLNSIQMKLDKARKDSENKREFFRQHLEDLEGRRSEWEEHYKGEGMRG